MYAQIEEVIASVDKRRSITTLFTNGFFLSEKVESLSRAGLDTIAISIDHYNLKIHDLKRKLP
jgi:MoaA/NifB/PqqE/SkfB family radical SAM enzyme